ncbi:MAG: TAT-variant-translocated molybdopterin oxidoreductase [candidate division KSB1 bacterium]|nr:TAT-variant-translocated molybdopterin oxidoreductase [candidate division KSB1 bacterium]
MQTIKNEKSNHFDLSALRAGLGKQRGQQYWRSLEELANTEEFQQYLQNEFTPHAVEKALPLPRRDFLKLMGASLALAGLNACTRQPEEKIFPYVKPPEEIVPGKPLYFATALLQGGYASGVLVESHEGRPTKVEGNPEHPASLGATDIFAQAAILTLYDPERSEVVINLGEISTWEAFITAISTELEGVRAKKGEGLRILTETVTSPTLASQMRALLAGLPAAQWHQYEPAGRDQVRDGSRLAFGEYLETQYRFDRAEVIVSLDSNFLIDMPGSLRYAREFSAKRRIQDGQKTMNRLYLVESTPTLTGTMADHRLSMRPSEIASFAHTLAAVLGIGEEQNTGHNARMAKWIAALARDLQQHRGRSLIIAGEQQPAHVHALVHAMNQALGNVGTTVIYTDPVEARPVNQIESLRALANDMEAGRVDILLILGGNPVFTAPSDLNFADKLSRVRLRIHLSLYHDETSYLCHWHIPEAHALETWSDARAYDGTVTIMQPLIAPLYGGKSIHEVLAVFAGQPNRSSHDLVRDYWKAQRPAADFEKFWQTSLHDGLVNGTALPAKSVKLKPNQFTASYQQAVTKSESSASNIEIIFRPDPTIGDGRFANNGWLQELPKPLTKITWDNVAMISPAMAERMELANEDVVELKYQGRTVNAPIWITPGHPDHAVTVNFGYGRTRAGKIGTAVGVNFYALRTSSAPWFGTGLEIRKTGKRHALAATQMHHNMENRHLVRVGTLAEYSAHPNFAQELGHEPPPDLTLYPDEHKNEGYAWGMVIDLNACMGCNACTIACQAENNIPIVGKTEVARGREMHWIRIDRYYQGNLDDPDTYHQPVTCMHCEHAPCEVVCPVAATVHSPEGLNEMVYNRCVGTRYCSNNCPYKVRRFNFLQYSDYQTPNMKLVYNPDVTVRKRGIMEKCTFCVQRINHARITAKLEDRDIRDGEVVTACQQVCPAQAITFGNLNDPNSRVAKLKAEPLNYGLLTDLNTRPRTSYLAKLRNPNPELEEN